MRLPQKANPERFAGLMEKQNLHIYLDNNISHRLRPIGADCRSSYYVLLTQFFRFLTISDY